MPALRCDGTRRTPGGDPSSQQPGSVVNRGAFQGPPFTAAQEPFSQLSGWLAKECCMYPRYDLGLSQPGGTVCQKMVTYIYVRNGHVVVVVAVAVFWRFCLCHCRCVALAWFSVKSDHVKQSGDWVPKPLWVHTHTHAYTHNRMRGSLIWLWTSKRRKGNGN